MPCGCNKTDSTKKNRTDLIIAIDRKSFREDADGLHFHGTLSGPRVSLNGWVYWPEELKAQHGKTVPLYLNHEEAFTDNPIVRGTMSVMYNDQTWTLDYQAVCTDPQAQTLLKTNQIVHVSMGAYWVEYDLIRGVMIPRDVEILEGSILDKDHPPGIPESTVQLDSLFIKDSTKNDSKPEATEKCTSAFCDMIKKSRADKTKTDEDQDATKKKKPEEEKAEGDSSNKSTENNSTKSSLELQTTSSTSMTDKTETESTTTTTKDVVSTDSTKKEPETSKVEVNVDMTEINKQVSEMKTLYADFVKLDATKQKQGTKADDNVKVDAKEAKSKFYGAVNDSLKKFGFLDWKLISENMQKDGIGLDAIGIGELGASAGAQWLEDITVLPSGLRANLRDTCEVVEIMRGAKECHFTLIATPTPVDGTLADGTGANAAPNIPSDVSQPITDIKATPAERLLKQRLTDKAARSTNINLGNSIATTFRMAEGLDEDSKIITELDGLTTNTLAGYVIAGARATESLLTNADLMTSALIAQGKEALLKQGWAEAEMPGQAVCVMSATQMRQLMSDTTIQRFIEWVQEGDALKNGVIPLLHGVELRVSTKIVHGTGAGSPAVVTDHAYIYIKNVAVGLAFTKEMEIETARYPEQRATTIIGSYELVAKNKTPTAVVRVDTYSSG